MNTQLLLIATRAIGQSQGAANADYEVHVSAKQSIHAANGSN
jgi:hypothetical protein